MQPQATRDASPFRPHASLRAGSVTITEKDLRQLARELFWRFYAEWASQPEFYAGVDEFAREVAATIDATLGLRLRPSVVHRWMKRVPAPAAGSGAFAGFAAEAA